MIRRREDGHSAGCVAGAKGGAKDGTGAAGNPLSLEPVLIILAKVKSVSAVSDRREKSSYNFEWGQFSRSLTRLNPFRVRLCHSSEGRLIVLVVTLNRQIASRRLSSCSLQ